MIEKTKETLTSQLIVKGLIFILFFSGVFVAIPSMLIYLLMFLIIGNVVLGFVNDKRSVSVNIILFILSWLLLVFLVEYIATILGSVISLIHLLFFTNYYFKEDVSKKGKSKR